MTAPTDGAPTVEDQLANLAQLSNDALAGLETQIVTEFTAADESNDVERMSALADALDQVQTEAQSRGLNPTDPDGDGDDDTSTDNNPDAATDVTVTSAAADTDAASKEITAAADDTPEVVEPVLEPDPAPDVPPDVPAETPAAVDEPAPEPAASAAPEIPAHSKEATAVVDTPVIPVENRPVPAVAASTRVIVAGADLRGISAGVEFADGQQVNQAFLDRIDALRSAEGRGEHVLVASVRNEFPAERQLIGGQPGENAEKIRAAIGANVQETSALIASGGYCAPLESRYDVFGMGVSDRPVRDAFPGFQATRGGIRFIAPPTLAGDTGAVGVWTAAVDTTPGGATKNVLTVACGAEQTVSISAITLEMQFGNFMTRAYPEMVAANTNLGIIAQARLAEQTLLTSVSSLSTAVTSTFKLGTARDFLSAAARAASAYRTRHRLASDAKLRVLVPSWVRDAMREDIAASQSPATDNVLDYADAAITAWLASRNVTASWHLDDSTFTGAQTTGSLLDFPTQFKWYIFAEGTFLFLDGGTLDIGIVRDSTLVGTNDYRMFTENFEGIAKVGIESLQVTTITHTQGQVGGQLAAVSS